MQTCSHSPMTLTEAIALIDHPPLPAVLSVRVAGAASAHWADLGCGSGLFSLALAHFLPAGSTIEAIDIRPSISRQTTANGVTILPRSADFIKDDLALSGLDGILMANSLHYVRDKPALLLRFTGALLLVEYDTDRPVTHWVPYPLSLAAASTLLPVAGWPRIHKLGTRPSAYGRSEIYAALALRDPRNLVNNL